MHIIGMGIKSLPSLSIINWLISMSKLNSLWEEEPLNMKTDLRVNELYYLNHPKIQ